MDCETTVWAHSNWLTGGKAKGKKLARVDHIGAYACYACHMVLDGQAKRPDGMTMEFVLTRFEAAMRESEEKLREKGLWPSDEFLAAKPVTAHKPIQKKVTEVSARAIVKKVVPLEERAREPAARAVRASKFSGERKLNKRITPASTAQDGARRAASCWPQGRKLTSANRLQSRPFGRTK